MPGLIVFRRRWSVGSDDLVVPGLFLFTIHLIWIIILSVSFLILDYDVNIYCIHLLWLYKLGYMGILVVSIFIELAICIVSMRGSILDTGPRASMHYWLYIKFVVILIDLAWLSLGIVWLIKFYMNCSIGEAKEIMLGLVISNWMIFLSILVTIWCTFDAAGRSWVKMKQYQRSMKESESRFNYKRSGSMNRNWRQRKVIRAYQDSWDHRCRLLFCCMGTSERNRNSFADIAKLLSDFFRELDVVPSDVVAGLVLLRKFQKVERQAIVRQKRHGTYEFLSGVPITERTQFLALNDNRDYDHFQTVIYYMHYAMGAYGWPMFLMTHSTTGVCQLCSEFRCCMSCCGRKATPDIIEDNCCYCNYTALKRMISVGDVEIIYTTFHVDVGETPFFVAIDYTKSKIVISIRGTLSMKDVLTDLNAEGEVLPLTPPKEDWLGHKGMVQAAVYIRNKLFEHNLIQRSMLHNQLRNTHQFGLVLVGHSLGAGTASILAVLLRQDYPSIQCFSYSPPGGLLSMPVVEYTKSFITSVVVGKDVVPRIGLHQMEALRADLINAIKRSIDPKWKTIACTMICCCCGPQPTSVVEMGSHDANVNVYGQQRNTARKASTHPNDSSIALTLHHPLYPPGRIIHIVRHHPTADEQVLKSHEPVYQAIWVDNTDFDEVLISPAMIQDHMPDTVLAALNKVVTTYGPRKPQRHSSNANSSISSDVMDTSQINQLSASSPTPQQYVIGNGNFNVITPITTHKVCLETSFTSLHSPLENQSGGGGISIGGGCGGGPSSKTSSLAGSVFGRNQLNSILQYDVSSIVDDSLTTRSPSMPSEATTVLLVDPNLPYHYQTPQTSTASTQFYYPHPHHHQSHQNYRGKNVAFDNRISITPTPSPTLNSAASPNVIPKSILHRQITSAYEQQSPLLTKPQQHQQQHHHQLQLHSPFLRCHLFGNTSKIDLVHDDWYGMAPLASPETLSEISSISSRTSLIYNINGNNNDNNNNNNNGNNHHSNNINKHTNNYTSSRINRYLPNVTNSNSNNNNNTNKINNNMNENISDEAQMHTPKVMRRTPKVSDNLATCADNLRLVDSYKRMGKIFISNSSDIQSNSNNNSSQGSFDISDPISISSKEKSYESDNDVDSSDVIIQQSDYYDRLTMENLNVFKNLDEKIIIEKSVPFKINSNVQMSSHNQQQSAKHGSSSSMIEDIHSKPMGKNTNFLESHFPVFYNQLSSLTPPPKVTLSSSSVHHPMEQNFSNITENTILLSPSSPSKIDENAYVKNKTITFSNTIKSDNNTINFNNNNNNNNNNKKRNTSEDQCFSRNESLPLLSNLSEKSSPTNFVKRKKMVFPMNTSTAAATTAAAAASSTTRRNESNV